LSIGGDLDSAQATGDGNSIAFSTIILDEVEQLTIADSLDVSKIRALNTGHHSANSNVTMEGGNIMIGFEAATPGNLEMSRVLTTESGQGIADSRLTFVDADIDVANDVVVGELALGGANPETMAMARLYLIDSKIKARDVIVASRLDGTAGSISGNVDLRRSLAVVQGTLMLSNSATLTMHLDGTTRAVGDGLAGDYSAVDADMAMLDGALEILGEADYAGPSTRGATDSFVLISSPFGITGVFDSVIYEGQTIGTTATYVGGAASGEDGLFSKISQTTTEFVLENYLAIPGDANGDGFVDASDFNVWNANKFNSSTNWNTGDFNGDGVTDASDFNIWNGNKFTSASMLVPEPGGLSIMATLLVASFFLARARRHPTIRKD
jgi:hypothetical protein